MTTQTSLTAAQAAQRLNISESHLNTLVKNHMFKRKVYVRRNQQIYFDPTISKVDIKTEVDKCPEGFQSIQEAAQRLNLSQVTIGEWVANKKIKAKFYRRKGSRIWISKDLSLADVNNTTSSKTSDKWETIKEAAVRLNLSESNLYQVIVQERIKKKFILRKNNNIYLKYNLQQSDIKVKGYQANRYWMTYTEAGGELNLSTQQISLLISKLSPDDVTSSLIRKATIQKLKQRNINDNNFYTPLAYLKAYGEYTTFDYKVLYCLLYQTKTLYPLTSEFEKHNGKVKLSPRFFSAMYPNKDNNLGVRIQKSLQKFMEYNHIIIPTTTEFMNLREPNESNTYNILTSYDGKYTVSLDPRLYGQTAIATNHRDRIHIHYENLNRVVAFRLHLIMQTTRILEMDLPTLNANLNLAPVNDSNSHKIEHLKLAIAEINDKTNLSLALEYNNISHHVKIINTAAHN